MQTRFTGEIRITPPLDIRELLDCPFVMADEDGYEHSVRIEVVVGDDHTPVGTAIVPVMEDAYKGYDMLENIQTIVDRYGDGRRFTGHLLAEGEDHDVSRFVVRDGRAVQAYAGLVWPDEIAELVKAADIAQHVLDEAAEGSTVGRDGLADLVNRVRKFAAQYEDDEDDEDADE